MSCVFVELYLSNQNDPEQYCQFNYSSSAHFLYSSVYCLDLDYVFYHANRVLDHFEEVSLSLDEIWLSLKQLNLVLLLRHVSYKSLSLSIHFVIIVVIFPLNQFCWLRAAFPQLRNKFFRLIISIFLRISFFNHFWQFLQLTLYIFKVLKTLSTKQNLLTIIWHNPKDTLHQIFVLVRRAHILKSLNGVVRVYRLKQRFCQ